jgi:hypothetical protein
MNQVREQLMIYDRQGKIRKWWDRRLTPGEEVDRSITSQLRSCDIILLFISPSFMASNYCYDVEMKQALRQHEERRSILIPVILRDCEWRSAPFGKLLAVPKDGCPITMWADRDQATKNVADQVMRVVDRLREFTEQPQAPSAELRADVLVHNGVEFRGISPNLDSVDVFCHKCGTALSSPPRMSRMGMFCNSCGFVAWFNRNGLKHALSQLLAAKKTDLGSDTQVWPRHDNLSGKSFNVLKWFSQIDPINGAANVDIVASSCRLDQSEALECIKELWNLEFLETAVVMPGEWYSHYKITPEGRRHVRLNAR